MERTLRARSPKSMIIILDSCAWLWPAQSECARHLTTCNNPLLDVSFVRCQIVSKSASWVEPNSMPLRFVRAMLHYNIVRLCIGQRKLTQVPRSHMPNPSGTTWFLCYKSVRVTRCCIQPPHKGDTSMVHDCIHDGGMTMPHSRTLGWG